MPGDIDDVWERMSAEDGEDMELTIDTALDPDVAVLIASCTVASVEDTGVGLKYANSK